MFPTIVLLLNDAVQLIRGPQNTTLAQWNVLVSGSVPVYMCFGISSVGTDRWQCCDRPGEPSK
jgi:hypothetical protein